jgi:hypothetical protein
MVLLSLQRGLSLLLAAWVACTYAQDAASDVKSIPLRTHSLSQVSTPMFAMLTVAQSLTHLFSLTWTLTFNPAGSILAAAPLSAPINISV